MDRPYLLLQMRRQTVTAAVAFALTFAVGGCTQSLAPPLPDLTRTSNDSLMTPAQQQKAIQDLSAKKGTEEAEALKKIESSH